MTGTRQGNIRRATATGGAIAMLLALTACGGGDEASPVAESAPAPAASAAPAATADPATAAAADPAAATAAEATQAPDAEAASGVASGTGVGAVHVRSTHITSWGWGEDEIREPIVALIKAGKLDNVQLDIKDEDGIVGYDSQVALAKAAGTVYNPIRFDAATVLKEIHDLGATVTGRIVAFRDPRLGKWAVKSGKMDMLIQDSAGRPYPAGNYGVGAFTNFANPEVIEYNIALGEEAAKLGFDSIMYDYIRKPENTGQVYPGIGSRTPTEAITDFVELAGPRIRAAGASAGAAVYGISSFAPSSVAQDIPEMAKHLDYVSPMIYPSHWNSGEYSVSSPIDQPYDIVKRSLMDFNRMVLGTDCAIVPWLQNFSYPTPYTASDVGAQIKASRDVGINSFYLWHASSKVGLGAPALLAGDPADNVPGQIVYSINKPGNFSEGTTDIEKAKLVFDAYQAWSAAGREGTFVNPLDAPSPAPTASATPASTTSETQTTAP
ncbi:MAG: putative glycoside hydrolase [Sporichthyaceae bacterium]